MSLFESLESNGSVSLRRLFDGDADIGGRSELSIVRPSRRSTVTRFRRGKARERPVFSSWEAISAEVAGRLSNA
ncbi:MAG: hypothetical protein LBS92_02855, partial [Candidatus Methanoplasma sp.]|nr:hypothetical protein [Candidatus Methanoplasma sp.]